MKGIPADLHALRTRGKPALARTLTALETHAGEPALAELLDAAFAEPKAQARLSTLIVQAIFKQGEQRSAAGEHALAGEAYLRAAHEFPNDERAAQAETERPSLVACHTHIAHGSPNLQDSAEAHGAPLGEAEVRATKEAIGWPPDAQFYVPDGVRTAGQQTVKRGQKVEAEWTALFERYRAAYPEQAALLETLWAGQLPEGWQGRLPTFTADQGAMATRKASGVVLNAIAPALPTLIGGSADLAPSNNTHLKGYGDFQAGSRSGRNFHFGVREHGMGGVLNGMALHGGVQPYGGTFMVFSDYMRPSVRVAAIMGLPVVYVWTHDSAWIGEDGPTHQPIEHLAALRAIPNLVVIRPADANETAAAWRVALERRDGPTALALTRQSLPILAEAQRDAAETVARGAYTLADSATTPDIILIATGSEVQLAMAVRMLLAEQGVAARVVSMPSWELFDAQPASYRDAVLPPAVTARLAIEAGIAQGWCKYVGPAGGVIGLDHYGASAPYKVLMSEFGFTAEAVAERALRLIR